MKSAIVAAVLTALVSLPAHAAPVALPVELEARAPIRYVSPIASVVNKWINTANVTAESIAYAKSLLELDSKIETIYKGDGKIEPTTPYNPFVNTTKAGVAEIVGASGTAAASAADVAFQRNWAQIATAAYCDPSAISAWSCATCTTNTYGKPSSIVSADQNDARFYGGYIASSNQIFIAFRGSSNAANWLTNLNFGTTSYWISGKAPSGASFHTGFQSLYSSVSGTVRTFVTNLAAAYPTASIVFTGHSLGGALAMHAALDLSVTGYVSRLSTSNIRVFTYGEPRIGNNAAGVWITGRGWAGVYRGVNYDDIVPHLPYQWMGFRHHRREWWILSGGTNVVTCNDVNASDNEDSDCLNSIVFASTSAHGLYFSTPMGSGC
ncbi:Alpha/Beta hydrolase protein [Cladochytrium replicatum]|nr:Alpha/Beta hydrolase protein [Cladochytrium replicatum]